MRNKQKCIAKKDCTKERQNSSRTNVKYCSTVWYPVHSLLTMWSKGLGESHAHGFGS